MREFCKARGGECWPMCVCFLALRKADLPSEQVTDRQRWVWDSHRPRVRAQPGRSGEDAVRTGLQGAAWWGLRGLFFQEEQRDYLLPLWEPGPGEIAQGQKGCSLHCLSLHGLKASLARQTGFGWGCMFACDPTTGRQWPNSILTTRSHSHVLVSKTETLKACTGKQPQLRLHSYLGDALCGRGGNEQDGSHTSFSPRKASARESQSLGSLCYQPNRDVLQPQFIVKWNTLVHTFQVVCVHDTHSWSFSQ